ncbi:hypothetical protein SAE02_72640 [Skermanella aerolata]|uniref:DUF2249 domain-containing protein n=1 Tax=Skermanella aerolata TaxID=393310 RepID=A0A512E347_9PROT|nr:DUF2249 domain-containing protein [Skermanella aerolata]KJB90151.1 hypothetical protein N826_38760 [Skermanella aerolata KACC 11604]GEO43116.1 hypothetical protein SAE02_72640 [Skermanella aerolata]
MSAPTHPLDPDMLLADAIAGNADAVERLSTLNQALAGLLDPAHRHAMTGQIRLGEAARVAGVSFETLCRVLREEAPASESTSDPEPDRPSPREGKTAGDWFEQAERLSAPHLDVRPLLASGQDPFSQVMSMSAQVQPGGFMVVDAPFDPAPLRRVLAKKGFTSLGRQFGPSHWRICWRREMILQVEAETDEPMPRHGPEPWNDADGIHLDVRGLQPPEPLTRVLDLIDQGETDNLVLHHDREPVFLYPMLAERGWSCLSVEHLQGEVRIRLVREPS